MDFRSKVGCSASVVRAMMRFESEKIPDGTPVHLSCVIHTVEEKAMADKRMGLLVAGFDYSGVSEEEFNAWYDTEHIPERRAVPGFINCERWIGADNPKISLATYDLESLDVLQSDAYRKIGGANLSPWSKRMTAKSKRICRFEALQMPPGNQRAPASAPALLIVSMNVTPEAEADFNAWYDKEHIPALSKVEGCLSARRFSIVNSASDGNQRYLAVYHLGAPGVCSSDAWKKAVDTEWTARVRPHFRDPLRIVLKRYERKA